jgi:hypothetical protein
MVTTLADYVRRERGLRPVEPIPDGPFPRAYLRPIVFSTGMVALTVAALIATRVEHETRGAAIGWALVASAGWAPALFIRTRACFRVLAVALFALGVVSIAAWFVPGPFLPFPALLATPFRAPPRGRRRLTLRIVASGMALCAAVTAVAATQFPLDGEWITICYSSDPSASSNAEIYGEATATGLHTLPGVETILGESEIGFEPFAPRAQIDRVIERARAHPNVASVRHGRHDCAE